MKKDMRSRVISQGNLASVCVSGLLESPLISFLLTDVGIISLNNRCLHMIQNEQEFLIFLSSALTTWSESFRSEHFPQHGQYMGKHSSLEPQQKCGSADFRIYDLRTSSAAFPGALAQSQSRTVAAAMKSIGQHFLKQRYLVD